MADLAPLPTADVARLQPGDVAAMAAVQFARDAVAHADARRERLAATFAALESSAAAIPVIGVPLIWGAGRLVGAW